MSTQSSNASGAMRWQAIAGILVLLCFVIASYAVVTKKQLNLTRAQLSSLTGTVGTARPPSSNFGALALEAFDLQQEVGFRSTGPVPTEPVRFEPPLQAPEARPLPLVFRSSLTVGERNDLRYRLSQIVPTANRSAVSVIYGARDTTAAKGLRQIGYSVSTTEMTDSIINSVIFGDSVSTEDVQIILLTLLEAGIRPSRIRRSAAGEGVSRTVMLTYVPYAEYWAPLTYAQIVGITITEP